MAFMFFDLFFKVKSQNTIELRVFKLQPWVYDSEEQGWNHHLAMETHQGSGTGKTIP